MIEIRGDKKVLVTPVSAEDLADIKIGDIVWLDGDLMTCRDVAHRRLVEYGSPRLNCSLIIAVSLLHAARLVAPGIPPGMMSHSVSGVSSTSAITVSAITFMELAPVTSGVSFMETRMVLIPARRRMSAVARASISSKPSARKR